MVDILLQVLADTFQATRGGISTIKTKHRGQPTREVKASKPNSPKLRNQHQRVLLAQKYQGVYNFLLHNSEPRHKTTWNPSCVEVKMGKRSSISQVSVNLNHRIKFKQRMNWMDGDK